MKKILFIALVMFLPSLALAAEFHFEYPQKVIAGESVVTVKLNTQGESVNALSGVIAIPNGVRISNILTGNSMVTLWIESPIVKDGSIAFSGITPGGIRGDVEIFSIVLADAGAFNFNVTSMEAFRNDGSGAVVETVSKKSLITVLPNEGRAFVIDDSTSPEPFSPLIGTDSGLYDGAPFVSFLAQDKGSGVKEYTWASTAFFAPSTQEWAPAETPLRIPSSSYASKIYIKAVDNAGNERVAVISGPYRYAVLGLGGILILLAIALCVLSFLKRRSSRS